MIVLKYGARDAVQNESNSRFLIHQANSDNSHYMLCYDYMLLVFRNVNLIGAGKYKIPNQIYSFHADDVTGLPSLFNHLNENATYTEAFVWFQPLEMTRFDAERNCFFL